MIGESEFCCHLEHGCVLQQAVCPLLDKEAKQERVVIDRDSLQLRTHILYNTRNSLQDLLKEYSQKLWRG